jgi:S1/P1 Nuclease
MKRTCLWVLFGLVCLAGAPSVAAWGCKGHQAVALIAERHLTTDTKQMVQKLLSENPIDPKLSRYCGSAVRDAMADASTWADDVRNDKKNGPWHFIDIPRGAKRGPLETYCAEEGCVTRAIAEQLAILKDKNADGAKRTEALRYIIHFVGDLHQPLHAITNADEGGNCVPLKYLRRKPREHNHSFSPNLHSLWDTAIPERDMEGADPGEYADTLAEMFAADIEGWRKAGIHLDDWAWESHDLAESTAYGALTPKIAIEPNVIVKSCADDNNIGERLLQQHITAGESYQEQAARVVERRLAQAGLRLAMILNEVAKAAL